MNIIDISFFKKLFKNIYNQDQKILTFTKKSLIIQNF